jgi:DNA invertase Pin-like site-specific DNA recombinase
MKQEKSRLLQALRAVRDEIYASVRLQLSDERLTYQQIADANGISLATVQRVAERSGISRPVGPRPKATAASEGENHAESE